MTTYNAYQGNTKIHHIYSGSDKVYYIYKGDKLVWRDRHYDKNEVVFNKDEGGDYTLEIKDEGIYEVTCVGAGGLAALTSVYDDRGYLATGGSGSAIVGNVHLTVGTYNIHVGLNNGSNRDSSISGVVTAYGGGNAVARSTVGQGGAIPTQILTFTDITINSAGNTGVYGTGGKGSAANFTRSRTLSVYDPDIYRNETYQNNGKIDGGYRNTTFYTNYGAGGGGGGSASEYGWRSANLPPMPGLVKIVYKRDV